MKYFVVAICLVLSGIGSHKLYAQDDVEKKWIAYKTPGDVHKMLAADDGDWKVEITSWMAPNTDPVKSTGTCTNKMILGGRYQQSHFTADMMGMPFEGIGTLGYDNVKKIFVSSWADNFGTGLMYMEGPWDDATKTFTLKGNALDPGTGKDVMTKQVNKVVDKNTRIMEMYMMMPDGKEFKNMEVKLTRK